MTSPRRGGDRRSFLNDASGRPDGSAVVWDVGANDGVGADANVIAKGNPADDFGSGTYVNIVPDPGRPSRYRSDRDLLHYHTVITDHHVFVKHESIRVRQRQISSECDVRIDV